MWKVDNTWYFWPILLGLLGLTAWVTWNADIPQTLNYRPDGSAEVLGESFPRRASDAFGYQLTLSNPPSRIVSGTLATDEILLDLIPASRISALTFFATDEGASNCADKARALFTIPALRIEPVLALNPDLILTARFSDAQVVAQLRQCEMPVFCFGKYDSLAEIQRNIDVMGRLLGEEERSSKMISWMRFVLEEVRRRTSDVKNKPKVMYYYLHATAGKKTIFDELVQLAGGRNVSAEAGIIGHQVISGELILALNPDVLILPEARSAFVDPSAKQLPKFLQDPLWSSIQAVEKGRVYGLPRKHLDCISHHIAKAAVDLGHALYPDRVPADLASASYSKFLPPLKNSGK